MKNFFLVVLFCFSSLAFGASGNEVTIADLKEATYKLIVDMVDVKNELQKERVVYDVSVQKSELDPFIQKYVKENKYLLSSAPYGY